MIARWFRHHKRGLEDHDDEEARVKRQRREDSAAPAASTPPPPPPPTAPSPQGTKRKSDDDGGRAFKQQKTDDTAAERLESLKELLFKLEDRCDHVAAKYQDLPLRVRRDVRHLHAIEQFVLAALLQHIHTPYGAAALSDVEEEMPIAELCPRDDLLREAKLAVGEAVAMGSELTYGVYRRALELLEAAPYRLKLIEAMMSRLKRSYAESITGVSERAVVLAWNFACPRILQYGDLTIGIEGGKYFLSQWEALDDFVATKYEGRRYFDCDVVSLFAADSNPAETPDFETDEETDAETDEEAGGETDEKTESAKEEAQEKAEEATRHQPRSNDEVEEKTDGQTESTQEKAQKETEEIARHQSPPHEASKPATKAPIKRTKAEATAFYFAQYQREIAAEEAAQKKTQEEVRRAQFGLKTSQPDPFDTSSLPNSPPSAPTQSTQQPAPTITVGVPQEDFKAYTAAWNELKSTCGIADLPLPLPTNNVRELRRGLVNQLFGVIRSLANTEHWTLRQTLTALHAKVADDTYTDENLIKLLTQMFLAHGMIPNYQVEETGVGITWNGRRNLKQHVDELNALLKRLKKESGKWHEDMIDIRTNCKHLPVEQRTSRKMMVKAIFNGMMHLKEQVERAINRGGLNATPEDEARYEWKADPDPE